MNSYLDGMIGHLGWWWVHHLIGEYTEAPEYNYLNAVEYLPMLGKYLPTPVELQFAMIDGESQDLLVLSKKVSFGM